MDKFREYINANKSKLDVQLPDGLWERIGESIRTPERRKPTVINILYKLAAACVIGLAALGVYHTVMLYSSGKGLRPVEINPVIVIQKMDTIAVKSGGKQEDTKMISSGTVRKEKKKQMKALESETSASENILDKIENEYITLVNAQILKINATPILTEEPEYFNLFKDQLGRLNETEKALRESLKGSSVDDDRIISLINLYKEKINLLEILLLEIRKMNALGSSVNPPKYLNL